MLKIAPSLNSQIIPNFAEAKALEFLDRLASFAGKIEDDKRSGALASGRVDPDELRIVAKKDENPFAFRELKNEFKEAQEAQRDSNRVLFNQYEGSSIMPIVEAPIETVIEEAREANRVLSYYPDYDSITQANNESLNALTTALAEA